MNEEVHETTVADSGSVAGTLLVVDDDAVYHRLLELVLRPARWRVLGAATHDEALDLIEGETDIDLVLLDYSMYGSGPEGFLERFARLERRPRVVGHSALQMRREFEELGVHEFVVKPLNAAQLVALAADPAPSGCDAEVRERALR